MAADKEKSKILVVDDEPANIEALAYILKPIYTVLVAKDGLTALEYAENKSPDLILLDVIMPGISGFDTLARLKSSDLTRRIPVIFITGMDSPEDERKGLALGAVDYITKPFHDFIVEARVKNHIQMVRYVRTIEHMCMIDTLTNIPNRRHFDNQLAAEWKLAARNKSPIGILMLDIDKFKVYNDTYGHPQGDILLKTIAELLEQTLNRPTDFVARWGGEEFVVLLPNTGLDGAMVIAERIRANVEGAVVPCDGKDTKVTISIGVNSEFPAVDSQADGFVCRADKALYNAKETGRNKVVHL